MAHMIPPVPKEYDERSDEGAVFKALQKLPDDYYVFHSVKGTVVENDVVYERELDFVVAKVSLNLGCFCYLFYSFRYLYKVDLDTPVSWVI